MVRIEARANTTKRRKVGLVKAPPRESKRERAGLGSCWWMRLSLRQAALALCVRRLRRLRSRRRTLRVWLAWAERERLGRWVVVRRRWEVARVDMGASLVLMWARYLHCTKKAPSLRPLSKRAK